MEHHRAHHDKDHPHHPHHHSHRPAQTSLGVDEHVAGMLAYSLLWASAVLVLLLERDSRFVRFHALQSLVLFGFLHMITILPIFGFFLSPFIFVLTIGLWIGLMVQASRGKRYKLPFIGAFAERESR